MPGQSERPRGEGRPPAAGNRPPTIDPDAMDALVVAVQFGNKYRLVTEELIRHLGERELANRRNLKEAIKATKNKLHQVGAAYWPGRTDYARWLRTIQAAQAEGPARLRAACVEIMAQHASARERLPILETFHATILSDLGPIRSVLDVGCGLNPLAIPWMPLAEGATYYAWDIYEDLMAFLQRFFFTIGVAGRAEAHDVLRATPPRVQVAYLLKAIPCLEQIDKDAGIYLLETIPAEHLLVSFPIQSLGGRQKGMAANYEGHFHDLVRGKGWQIERFFFETELVFRVKK